MIIVSLIFFQREKGENDELTQSLRRINLFFFNFMVLVKHAPSQMN